MLAEFCFLPYIWLPHKHSHNLPTSHTYTPLQNSYLNKFQHAPCNCIHAIHLTCGIGGGKMGAGCGICQHWSNSKLHPMPLNGRMHQIAHPTGRSAFTPIPSLCPGQPPSFHLTLLDWIPLSFNFNNTNLNQKTEYFK